MPCAAFGRRDYHAAYDAYTQLLGLGNGSHAEALINRSVVAYKLGIFLQESFGCAFATGYHAFGCRNSNACVGEHGIALDDADAAIAALGGAFGVDDTLLVKAHYRRVSGIAALAQLRVVKHRLTRALLACQIAAIVGLGHGKDIANAVRRGMAAFSLPEPAQRLRAALAMETSPLTANWLAEVFVCYQPCAARISFVWPQSCQAARGCSGL